MPNSFLAPWRVARDLNSVTPLPESSCVRAAGEEERASTIRCARVRRGSSWYSAVVTWTPLAFAGLISLLSACSTEERAPMVIGGASGESSSWPTNGQSRCATADVGCPCGAEGSTVECGEVTRRSGDYVACSMGVRTCLGGVWSECVGDKFLSQSPARAPVSGERTLALAGAAVACVGNPCDPGCQVYQDTPAGLSPDSGFTTNATGLTTVPSVVPSSCSGLSLTPATKTITVSALSPFTTDTGNVTYLGQLTPSGCYSGTANVLYGLDKADRAAITSGGVFSLLRAVAGPIQITAYANGMTATASANVIVRVRDTSAVSSTEAGKYWTSTGALQNPTLASSNVRWLYPYNSTVLPLGLLAPVLQWQTAGAAATSIKISLRYSSGSTSFEYSALTAEPALLRYTIPQSAWQAFEQSARGQDATIVIQRSTASGLEPESSRTIHFADGQLKGTVYYNSYNSAFNGSKGAVLAIKPGASAPALAVPSQAGKCHVCHSLSADGSRLFFQNQDYDSSSVYDPASGALVQTYNNTGSPEWGNRFDWGAIYPDGTMGLAHAQDGYHVFGGSSALFPVIDNASTGTTISLSGFGSSVKAVTPAISPDGRRLIFNFWSGTGANGVTPQAGKSLVSADFSCGAATGSVRCSPSPATSATVSNWRELIKVGVSPYTSYKYVGWPQFLPDSKGALFNMFTRTPTGCSGSCLYTWQGAQAEIWLVNVPSSASVSPQPVRLTQLNGTGLIPGTTPGPPAPAPSAGTYHTTGNTVYWAGSGCGLSPTQNSGTVSEDQLNFMPTIAPQESGGYYWVVFTSRRLYGNTAVNTPWEYEECVTPATPPTKKLWIAAIDKNWTPGTDPSHPAFYLPGQELLAGNMRGFWSKSPCITPGSTGTANQCETDDDCCGGASTPKTAACRVDLGSTPVTRHCQAIVANSCSAIGSSCSVASDCCQVGAVCLSGVCKDPLQYVSQSFSRDYQAICPSGKHVVWRAFDWKASEVSDDHIDFTAQTWSVGGSPGPSVAIGTAASPPNPTNWIGVDVGARLTAAAQASYENLRVTATFVPSANAQYAPTLIAWRQTYDCVDAE